MGSASTHFVAGWRYQRTMEGFERPIPVLDLLASWPLVAVSDTATQRREMEHNFRSMGTILIATENGPKS